MIQISAKFNSDSELSKLRVSMAALGLIPCKVKHCGFYKKVAFRPAQPTTADQVPAALAKNQDKQTNE